MRRCCPDGSIMLRLILIFCARSKPRPPVSDRVWLSRYLPWAISLLEELRFASSPGLTTLNLEPTNQDLPHFVFVYHHQGQVWWENVFEAYTRTCGGKLLFH